MVFDLDQYRQVDPKIQRVRSVEGPDDEGRGSARILGKVKGLPPAPDRQDFVLEPWTKLTFTGAARQPARLIFDFTGTITCHVHRGGTTDVTHSYEFKFKGPDFSGSGCKIRSKRSSKHWPRVSRKLTGRADSDQGVDAAGEL